jgi:rod shape-determining protein MreB
MAAWNKKLKQIFSNDIGIDLGTANSLVFVRDHGIVLSEPSVVAVDGTTNKVLAVGMEGKKMLGRTPGNIRAIRPMKEGVIADFEITEEMLRYFIQKVHSKLKIMQPRILIAVPSGITPVEDRAVKDSALRAGAREVFVIEEPMAAAIGVGIPVQEPCGSMIVDIGGGTTEVAVISLSGIVVAKSLRVGGDTMDEAITKFIKRSYSLLIGERTAETIKIEIGSAYPMMEEMHLDVKGRDLNSGLPKTIQITSTEIFEALQEPVSRIINTVKGTLESCPPELAADLIDHGIVLAGGGALLRGIDQILAEETGLPVIVADEPLLAVAKGTGVVLQEMDTLSRIVASSSRATRR